MVCVYMIVIVQVGVAGSSGATVDVIWTEGEQVILQNYGR